LKAKAATESKIEAVQERRDRIQAISPDLYSLFAESAAHKRGKTLESVLNRLFEAYEMLVRESFTVKGACGEGIIAVSAMRSSRIPRCTDAA
jgi:restriction system protein